jgi:hypothetical protein
MRTARRPKSVLGKTLWAFLYVATLASVGLAASGLTIIFMANHLSWFANLPGGPRAFRVELFLLSLLFAGGPAALAFYALLKQDGITIGSQGFINADNGQRAARR